MKLRNMSATVSTNETITGIVYVNGYVERY